MTTKQKNKLADYGATFLGIAAAIANAWINIDWVNFNLAKEWPKLFISAIIALVGYKSRIKTTPNV